MEKLVDDYPHMTGKNFILNYEVELMSYFAKKRSQYIVYDDDGEIVELLDMNIIEIEKEFIRDLNTHITNQYFAAQKLLKRSKENNENDPYDLTLVKVLLTHNTRREFLEYKLHQLDESEKLERVDEFQQNQEDSILDYSKSTGTEKIIYLKKLGVLDFLKNKEPFNTSKNALATALSGMIGVPAGTIQSYINPINNPSVSQSNNPLNKASKVNKVITKLSDIGFRASS